MQLQKETIEKLMNMAHSRVQNYVVPGLTSLLLGQRRVDPQSGCVRMFIASRDQELHVTPHSHRYDLECLVLAGSVCNTLYLACPDEFDPNSDPYRVVMMKARTSPADSNQELSRGSVAHYAKRKTWYSAGKWYGMKAEEIHTVEFSRDAVVLIFEGPMKHPSTTVLLPHVDGLTIDTLIEPDWMFIDE